MRQRHDYSDGPLTVAAVILGVLLLAFLLAWAIGEGLAHLVIA